MKKEFKDFILSLNDKKLEFVEPLLYRRVLGYEKANRIKNSILECLPNFQKS